MDAGQIEERLLFVLREDRHDELFSGASAVDLVLEVRRAAQRMVDEESTTEEDVERASRALKDLVAEMDSQRGRLGFSEFQELTLREALSKLCPGFWPFC